MSMFNIGLSGLQSTQTGLEVTSNNIANSSTSGYKTADVEFAAVYNGGSRGGVEVASITEDFTKSGDMVRTGNALDMAIDGQGFFAVKGSNNMTAYTQAGQFQLDSELNIVNANGARLQGYGISEGDNGGDPSIVSGVLTDLKVEGTNIPAEATTKMDFSGNLSSASDVIPYPTAPDNFDPTDGSQYNFSQSTEIFDSLGNSHVVTQYFNHTGSNQWDVMYFVDGQPLTAAELGLPGGAVGSQDVDINGATVTAGVVSMSFDSDGELSPLDSGFTSPAPPAEQDNNDTDPYGQRVVNLTFTPLDADGNPNGAGPMSIDLNLTETTQFGSDFAMYNNDADGYTAGEFSGVSVDNDGKIYATFSNGESKLQGQVALASFANVDGLEPNDDTTWIQTQDSGAPLFGEPSSGAVGNLVSGSFMSSNVDISQELVGLMSFQQNYQANAKTISSADEMMQILFNNT